MRQKIQAKNFHIVGGGCFGSQYLRCLLRARRLRWLEFDQIFFIDQDAQCQAIQAGLEKQAGVTWVQADWTDYLTDLLIRQYSGASYLQDHWVPSPLSPHLFLIAFSRALEKLNPHFNFKLTSFKEEVSSPVQIPLKVGTYAVSYAQWKCPTNCIEPSNCPVIQEKRSWDMKTTLQAYFSKQDQRSSHVLQCAHLVHGVGTISMSTIMDEFKQCMEQVQREDCREVVVATVSACHGIIGQAVKSIL